MSIEIGQQALLANNFAAAEKHFSGALAKNPYSIKIIRLIAELKQLTKKTDAAISFAKKAFHLYPNSVQASFILSKCLASRSKFREKIIQHGLSIDPSFGPILSICEGASKAKPEEEKTIRPRYVTRCFASDVSDATRLPITQLESLTCVLPPEEGSTISETNETSVSITFPKIVNIPLLSGQLHFTVRR
jgi:hypothetical protein